MKEVFVNVDDNEIKVIIEGKSPFTLSAGRDMKGRVNRVYEIVKHMISHDGTTDWASVLEVVNPTVPDLGDFSLGTAETLYKGYKVSETIEIAANKVAAQYTKDFIAAFFETVETTAKDGTVTEEEQLSVNVTVAHAHEVARNNAESKLTLLGVLANHNSKAVADDVYSVLHSGSFIALNKEQDTIIGMYTTQDSGDDALPTTWSLPANLIDWETGVVAKPFTSAAFGGSDKKGRKVFRVEVPISGIVEVRGNSLLTSQGTLCEEVPTTRAE